MRLLMLNTTPVPVFGGVERWMVRTAAGLIARGHAVRIAARPSSRLLAHGEQAGVPVQAHRFGADYNPLSAVRLARLIRRERIEGAIVNYNKELTHLALARRFCSLRGVVGRSVLPMMDTAPKYRWLYSRHLNGLITPSRQVRETVQGYPWMQGVQVRDIPNGIDLEAIDRAVSAGGGRAGARRILGLPLEGFVVGGVGRLEPHKGFHHLVAAFGRLPAQGTPAHLVLIGDGSERARLQAQAEGLGEKAGCVQLAGFRENIPALLPALDVLVLPATTAYETFGQVLIEAMACRVAVVGSRIGGIPEVVEEGNTGRLVPPADEAALAGILRELAGQADHRRWLGEQGRRRVQQHFREEIMLDRIETFLGELLEGER